jgi:hypothetical protein
VRLGGDVLVPRWAAGSGAVDPFRVGVDFTPRSVGGGHPNRALAHGYSRLTPSGYKDRLGPNSRTLRVQPKQMSAIDTRQGTHSQRLTGKGLSMLIPNDVAGLEIQWHHKCWKFSGYSWRFSPKE